MADREKLVEIVCNAIQEVDCISHCNHPPCYKVHHVVDELIAHGVTVREPQKPLTLEELSDETDMYWVENEDGCFPVLLWDKSYCFSTFSQFGTEQDVELNNDDYGKTWRCWAEKPTEEERKAAEWRGPCEENGGQMEEEK